MSAPSAPSSSSSRTYGQIIFGGGAVEDYGSVGVDEESEHAPRSKNAPYVPSSHENNNKNNHNSKDQDDARKRHNSSRSSSNSSYFAAGEGGGGMAQRLFVGIFISMCAVGAVILATDSGNFDRRTATSAATSATYFTEGDARGSKSTGTADKYSVTFVSTTNSPTMTGNYDQSAESKTNNPTPQPAAKAHSNPTGSPTNAPAYSSKNSDEDVVFTLTRTNYQPLGYFTDDSEIGGILQYKILEDYVSIIEPSAPMTLYVISGDDEYVDTDTKSYWEYTVCNSKGSKCSTGSYYPASTKKTEDVTIQCKSGDKYEVEVVKYDKSGNEQYTVKGDALCMYVRREIRTLTSDDLDATMDAMYTLWSTSESKGQKKYGDNYHASTYFTEAHHFNAAWQDGDHIHEGMGFLPQHLKMTNFFEDAMQAVDASVTLPYWDFTIDNEQGASIFESFIFTPNTFGSLPAPSNGQYWTYKDDEIDDGKIPDGRWASIEADSNTRFEDIPSAFGYMRGPWNMNPSAYITRYGSEVTSIPGCSAYYQWAEETSYGDFLYASPYLPHASLHGAVGGVYGCDMFDDMLSAGLITDESSQTMICTKWGFYLKELYRGNYISPKTDCSASKASKCGFTCNEDQLSDMAGQVKKTINNMYTGDLSTTQWESWRDFICDGDAFKVFVGDHLESASPSDPSFWPIHPNQERMLHAKLMSGGFDDWSWPTDATEDYVCDKSSCYESEYGAKGYYDDCCYGHYEDSQLLNWIDADKDTGYGPTNGDVLTQTDPTSKDYAMTYIYDDLKWSHCSSSSDFSTLFTQLYNARNTGKR